MRFLVGSTSIVLDIHTLRLMYLFVYGALLREFTFKDDVRLHFFTRHGGS